MSIGVMIAGGKSKTGAADNPRKEDDFYPTPPEATIALCRAEADRLRDFPAIWEPCCGDGAMAAVLQDHGHEVYASDIADRGCPSFFRADFLDPATVCPLRAEAIVTNPPYGDDFPELMVRRALGKMRLPYVALLLKGTYWSAAGRVPLWREFRPAREYKLTWRLDFLGQGSPTMECSWFVWDGISTRTETFLLPKPESMDLGEPRI